MIILKLVSYLPSEYCFVYCINKFESWGLVHESTTILHTVTINTSKTDSGTLVIEIRKGDVLYKHAISKRHYYSLISRLAREDRTSSDDQAILDQHAIFCILGTSHDHFTFEAGEFIVNQYEIIHL